MWPQRRRLSPWNMLSRGSISSARLQRGWHLIKKWPTRLWPEKPLRVAREHILQETDIFGEERNEQPTHRKAFRYEKEVISIEREDFWLEVVNMRMLRTVYLMTINRERHSSMRKITSRLLTWIWTRSRPLSLPTKQTIRARHLLKRASAIDLESVWICCDINGNCRGQDTRLNACWLDKFKQGHGSCRALYEPRVMLLWSCLSFYFLLSSLLISYKLISSNINSFNCICIALNDRYSLKGHWTWHTF